MGYSARNWSIGPTAIKLFRKIPISQPETKRKVSLKWYDVAKYNLFRFLIKIIDRPVW